MTIKPTFYLFVILLLFACGNDDMPDNPPTDYPKKYVLTGVDFNPSEFFEYQPDEYHQIFPEGILREVDSILLEEYYLVPNDPYFEYLQEIELLSDALARIKFGEEEILFRIDTTLCYELTEEKNQLIF